MKKRSSVLSVIVTAAIIVAALAALLFFTNGRNEAASSGSRTSSVFSEVSSSDSSFKEEKEDKTDEAFKAEEAEETVPETPAEEAVLPAPEETVPEPTEEPTETPAPEPTIVLDASGRVIPAEGEYLSDLETVLASTYVDESQLDTEHLEKYFRSFEISDALFERIYGDDRSFKTYCTVPREHLRYVKVLYRDFEDQARVGEIMINYLLADDILYIFEELYKARYPFNLIVLVDDFQADDDLSIAHNNTSAFNFRNITGGDTPSNHAYGTAIDINPYNNPYIIYDAEGYPTVLDEGAEAFLDRYAEDAYERHMINYDDLCYQLFTERGWQWGGDWTNPVDYQHFEKPIYP